MCPCDRHHRNKKTVFFILENFMVCTVKYDHAPYHFPLPTPSASSRTHLPPNFMSSSFSSLPTKSIRAVHLYVVVWLLKEPWEIYQWPHPPKRMSLPLPAAFPWPTNPIISHLLQAPPSGLSLSGTHSWVMLSSRHDTPIIVRKSPLQHDC